MRPPVGVAPFDGLKWRQLTRKRAVARRLQGFVMETSAITRAGVAATFELIRPHVRRTPVIEVDAADFNLEARTLSCKLELFQHTGSFKPRGALASLLSRPVPS